MKAVLPIIFLLRTVQVLWCTTLNFTVDCGDGFNTSLHHKDLSGLLSEVTDTSVDVCTRLRTDGHYDIQSGLYEQANDTLRLYIEKCANQAGSSYEFSELNSAVQFMSNDNNRWLDYRTWLKKVLYLNVDTLYYCGDVNSILTTFNYVRPTQGIDWNGSIAVIDYLLQNHRCPDASSLLLKLRTGTRDDQVQTWRDTVKDSSKTPIDTSAVTLEQLDLQILRGSQFAVMPSKGLPKGLGDLFATKNPFTDETTLVTTISDATMLKLEVYDLLGKKLYEENRFLSAGDVRWILNGKILPEGSIYARISTVNGEVKTIKLMRQ
jgi:hypothetical protein